MEITNKQKEVIAEYKKNTGRELTLLPDGRVEYVEKRANQSVKVRRKWSEIEAYLSLKNSKKAKSITTSSNKNIGKIIVEKSSEIFTRISKPKSEKFMNASCSIKASEYKQLMNLVKSHNTTINKLLQEFIRNLLSDSYK